MDADLDWCLTCERRLDGPEPYCSDLCKARAGPAAYIYVPDSEYDDDHELTHHIVQTPLPSTAHSWRSMPTDETAIAAWAADIPYGAPPTDAEPIASSSSSTSSSSKSAPGSFRAPPPPNLIRTPRRAVPPTLSMSSPPQPALQPSTPVLTPRRHPSTTSMTPSGYASVGQTSLCTAASSLALSTPPLSHPVPIVSSGSRQAHTPGPHDSSSYEHIVRSWVSPSPAALAAATARHYPHLQHLLPHDAALQKSASRNHLPAMVEPLAGSWRTEDVFLEQTFDKLPRVHTFRGDEHPSFRTRGRKESRAAA